MLLLLLRSVSGLTCQNALLGRLAGIPDSRVVPRTRFLPLHRASAQQMQLWQVADVKVLPVHQGEISPQLSLLVPTAAAFTYTDEPLERFPLQSLMNGSGGSAASGLATAAHSLHAGLQAATWVLAGAQLPSNMQAQSIKDRAPTWPPPKMMDPVRKKISHLQMVPHMAARTAPQHNCTKTICSMQRTAKSIHCQSEAS